MTKYVHTRKLKSRLEEIDNYKVDETKAKPKYEKRKKKRKKNPLWLTCLTLIYGWC